MTNYAEDLLGERTGPKFGKGPAIEPTRVVK
jgi:hypothetical protein